MSNRRAGMLVAALNEATQSAAPAAALLVPLVIRVAGVPTLKFTAIAVGPFGIFKDLNGWNVTHRESGSAVAKECCCVVGAIALAELITPLVDWTLPFREIETAAQAAGVAAKIDSLVCANCGEGVLRCSSH